jgi:hypothetical protein
LVVHLIATLAAALAPSAALATGGTLAGRIAALIGRAVAGGGTPAIALAGAKADLPGSIADAAIIPSHLSSIYNIAVIIQTDNSE